MASLMTRLLMARKKSRPYLSRAVIYTRPPFVPSEKQLEQQTFARRRPEKRGRTALQEVLYYQKSTGLLIPKAPFSRLVREVLADQVGATNIGATGFRIQSLALEVLQDSAEQILTHWLHCLNMSALHAKRKTVRVEDSKFFRELSKRIIDNPMAL